MITLFIPTYNGESLLPRTLNSILNQTYRDWEIVAVDDSSSDGTFSLLQQYAESDSRIRLFQKANGGDVPHSWQYAIPLFKGDWVLYLSQDDLLEPNTLQLLIERQQETAADVVFPHEVHYIEGLPSEKMFHLKGVAGDTSPILNGREAFRLMIDYSISGRGLWQTDIIRCCGISTETYNADELAQRQWALACNKVAFSEAMFYYCRGNVHSITECHSPRHYETCLTDAHLLQEAAKVFSQDDHLLTAMANAYYDHLLYMSVLYYQRHRSYTSAQRHRAIQSMTKAYSVLRSRCNLQSAKYHFTRIHPLAFRLYTYCKAQRNRRQGHILEDNRDTILKSYL